MEEREEKHLDCCNIAAAGAVDRELGGIYGKAFVLLVFFFGKFKMFEKTKKKMNIYTETHNYELLNIWEFEHFEC